MTASTMHKNSNQQVLSASTAASPRRGGRLPPGIRTDAERADNLHSRQAAFAHDAGATL